MQDDQAIYCAITSLTGPTLTAVLSHLSGRELAACACSCRQLRDHLAEDDAPWRALCGRELGMAAAPISPTTRAPLPCFRLAYAQFWTAYGGYGELAVRAWRAWRTIEDWTAQHMPAVHESLKGGADERALDEAEAALGVRFPPALRVLYRMHDGQLLAFDAALDLQRAVQDERSLFHGLFGGYCFYHHLVSTRFLPLRRMVRWTRRIRQGVGGGGEHASRVLFAASYNFNKLVLCDASDGSVLIPTVDKVTCLPAVPRVEGSNDDVLRWFEAYAAALASGAFGVEPLDPEIAPNSAGICLFPRAPPGSGEVVMRGVRVRAAPLFVPELSEAAQAEPQFFFAYSVRFSLLAEEEQAASWPSTAGPFRPLRSCQLRRRHWLIRDADGAVENEVHGDGVVGHTPLLRPGEPEFVYQSCTHQHQRRGAMDGHFSFAPGSLSQPEGPDFEAACPTIRLHVPEVIF